MQAFGTLTQRGHQDRMRRAELLEAVPAEDLAAMRGVLREALQAVSSVAGWTVELVGKGRRSQQVGGAGAGSDAPREGGGEHCVKEDCLWQWGCAVLL